VDGGDLVHPFVWLLPHPTGKEQPSIQNPDNRKSNRLAFSFSLFGNNIFTLT